MPTTDMQYHRSTPTMAGKSRHLSRLWPQTLLLGAILTSLTVSGCASTDLTVKGSAVMVPQPTEQLTVEPSLLVISPMTPLPPARKNRDWREREKIIDADHQRDRGQLKKLVGATLQKEKDQKQLNDAAREVARITREAIETANKEQLKVKKPFFKRMFGGIGQLF